MGSVLLPARQDKGSLVKLLKSPDAEICEKRAHIVLILPTSLPQGTDGCEPCVHNCDRVKFMNGTLNDLYEKRYLIKKKKTIL